jgi:hypothetical protein
MAKELTPKQEAFAQAVASGLTQSDAYRKAYTVSQKTKAESVTVKASQMMSWDNIRQRVQELRDQLSEKALWSREDSVRTLLEVIGNPDKQTDVITAVKELNAMHGFNAPQKIDHTSSDNSMTPKAPIELDSKMVKSILERISADI